MKAVVRSEYGGPEVLEVRDVEEPIPGRGEVLVRVRASSVNMADVDYLRGRPWATRLGTGLRQPKALIMGTDLAGEVEAVGDGVTRLSIGDRVIADLTEVGQGAWAEHVAVPAAALTALPPTVPWADAGCTPSAGIFAIQGVRDKRRVRPGDRVLVNGASGNVGPFAVQIAKALGAEVTATCRTQKMAMVRAIGADHIIDYTAEDYRQSGERYDLIVDMAARGGLVGMRKRLRPGGGYVVIGANGRGYTEAIVLGVPVGLATGRKMGILMWRVNDTRDMADLASMLESGDVKPHIDRSYALADVADAIRYLESGESQGKVAISF